MKPTKQKFRALAFLAPFASIVTLGTDAHGRLDPRESSGRNDVYCSTNALPELTGNIDSTFTSIAAQLEEKDRFALVLEDCTEIVLENIELVDERNLESEIEFNPKLAEIFPNYTPAYAEHNDLDFIIGDRPFDVAAAKRRPRYTNRGILGPKGQWPVGPGKCTTIRGSASYYGGGEKLKPKTASGKRFNPNSMSAAHRTLPLGSKVTVKNLKNGKVVENVVIDDRGPAIETKREIDLTRGVASKLGFIQSGHTQVEIRVCNPGGKKG